MKRTAALFQLLLVVLCCQARALAGALQLPPPPAVHFAPPANARLPLDVTLRDERGAARPLSAWFGDRAVVLVPGYYRCPNLCATVFEGVLQALALSGMDAGAYRLLGVSVDPREGPAAAAQRRAAYASLLPPDAALALLTGDGPALARVQAALGYTAAPDAASGELAHAAGFVVAAPDGRIVATFPGVRFDGAALGAAIRAAAAGAPAPAASLGQRLLLLCSHYDPASGRHTPLALGAVRAVALLVLAMLLGALWRWHARRTARGGAA